MSCTHVTRGRDEHGREDYYYRNFKDRVELE